MYCKNCGKQLPNGSDHCMYCNSPKFAGDINVSMDVLEVDELKDMLQRSDSLDVQKDTIDPEAEVRAALKKKKAIIISLTTIISGLLVVFVCSNVLGNSYGSLINQADEKYQKGEYVAAYELYEKALNQNENGTEALIGAAKVLNESGDYDMSESYIIKALDIDPENEVAYDVLIDSVSQANDPEKIVIAEQYAVTDRMKDRLTEIVIDPPVLSEPGGSFDDDVVITLSNKADYPMYYTVDGQDPTSGNGLLYEGPITIKEGTTTLRAACYNDGKFGIISEETYEITYAKPPYPTVSPSSGSFDEQTYITITSDTEGAKIYYTWDGSDPTTISSRYTSPIVVIPGNNVLSIIVVDKHGVSSEVLRCTYTYITDEDVDENVEVTDLPEHTTKGPQTDTDGTDDSVTDEEIESVIDDEIEDGPDMGYEG